MKVKLLSLFTLVILSTPWQGFAAAKIYCLGDSLTIGYGVNPNEAWPSLLQTKFNQAYPGKFTIINGGISGSTSASALGRLTFALGIKPDWLILALGANDGLRGLDTAQMKQNLLQTIELAQQNQIKVILVGMMMPPNYGPAYAQAFEKVYMDLAQETKVKFISFLLAPVAGVAELNQADGIHPNAQGHQKIAEYLYPQIKKWISP